MSDAVAKLVLGTFLAVLTAMSAGAAEFKVDPAHSFIQFQISHLGYSIVVGRFDKFSGTFTWDRKDPGQAAIKINIDTASIDTNWPQRDDDVRGPSFLDVEKFSTASFESTRFEGDASGGELDGMLTLHGVSRPIRLNVKAVGQGPDPWGGYRAGFRATTTLRRADFGLTHDLGPTAQTMDFDLFVEGVRQ